MVQDGGTPLLLTEHGQAEVSADYGELVEQLDYVDYPAMERRLRQLGLDDLSKLNGLAVAENLRLATTLDPLEMVDLLSKGLDRSRRRMLQRRQRLEQVARG